MKKVNYKPNHWKDKTSFTEGSIIYANNMNNIEKGITDVSKAVNELLENPIPGPQGEIGPEGPRGEEGLSAYELAVIEGFPGSLEDWLETIKGEKGEPGIQGPKGEKGDTGERGPRGDRGDIGPQGDRGDRGDQGPKGDRGEVGPQGPRGERGETGIQGLQGRRGEQGPQGERGPQGIAGPQGEKGERGERGPKGDIGEPGPQGLPGRDGITPDMTEYNNRLDNINSQLDETVIFDVINDENTEIPPLTGSYDDSVIREDIEYIKNKLISVVNAKFPPLEFNLEGLKGGSLEGDGQRLKNIIEYLSNNFSFSTLEIPFDEYRIECEITIPNNVRIYGINRPVLHFTINDGVAIYLDNNNHNNISCLELKGTTLENNVVALRVEGSSNIISDILIHKFKQGIDFARPNTYINTFDNIFIKETQLCLYGDYVGADTVNNAGERITFKNSTFCNSNELLFFNSGILDLFFDNCSLDYCKKFINANNGRVYLNNCHIETKKDIGDGHWATVNDYLIQTNNDPHLFFTNCEFHLYGIHRIVDPSSTQGEIRYNNCQCWFTNNEGNGQYCYSEHNFFWNIHSGMIQSDYNAFISKVSKPGCMMACDYNNKQTPSIPKMSMNVDECKLTFEFTEEQKPRENTFIKILF